MFSFKTAKVVGTPNGEAWSQVHDFKVEGEKLEKRGKLLVVLTLKKAGEGVEAVAAGREVLARINEEYYGNLEESPFKRLEATLNKLDKEFKNLELVSAVFYQKVGYFGILGGGKVVVKRGSRIQTILGLNSDSRILVGSGFVEEDDIFLLGSKKFFEEVAEGTWRAALGTGDSGEAVETLAPVVAGREKAGGVAAGVVKVDREIKPELREIQAQPVSAPSRIKPSLVGKFIRFWPRSVFIRRQVDQQKQKKTLLTVAAILIFLLLASVILGVRKRAIEQKRAREEEIVTQVKNRLEEARGLAGISPSEAKNILQRAQSLLEEASELRTQNSELRTLKEEIEKELINAVREHQLTEVPVFLDLSFVSQDVKGDDLGLYKDKLVVLDKKGRRVIEIDVSSKAHQILAGGEDLSGATQVALHDDKTYTLTEKGIWETRAGKTNLVIEKDEKWGQIIDLDTWMSNLYLLDKDKDTIWRYLVIEGGFGGAQNWMKGSAPDLSKATSFAIDGSIWITQQSSSAPLPAQAGVLKFTSGSQEAFSLVGLEKPLASPERIYTDDIANNLYILDKGNYRVVVLDKEGNYQASYLWVGITDVKDMVVSEEVKKIFLLGENKIYEIEIR